MLEPVILSDEILEQAESWHNECLRRWDDDETPVVVGEAILLSPVDGQNRRVVLLLEDHLEETDRAVKGKTAVGVKDLQTGFTTDGNTAAINRGTVKISQRELMPILLHEITHAIDPDFKKDFIELNTEPKAQLTQQEEYELPSEQRAFTAMWTADLKTNLEVIDIIELDDIISEFCNVSYEFGGFIAHCIYGSKKELTYFTADDQCVETSDANLFEQTVSFRRACKICDDLCGTVFEQGGLRVVRGHAAATSLASVGR